VLDELIGQVVQQLAIAGGIGQVHVVGRLDDADVEVMRPNAIDE